MTDSFIVIQIADVVGTNLVRNKRRVSVESVAHILLPPSILKDTLRDMNPPDHQAPATGRPYKSAPLGVE